MALRDQIRLLVVDDMSTSRGLLTQALDGFGIRNVAAAADANAALASLKSAPAHLVISDYNMPGMDGLELLRALRENPATKGVGFILVTGRADPEVIERGRALGMNNFIAKPFQPNDLRTCLEAVVGRL